MYTPVTPSFTNKSGVWRVQNYIGMFSWWDYKIHGLNPAGGEILHITVQRFIA